MIRLVAIGLALTLIASAQAAPHEHPSLHKRDVIVTDKGGSGGCPPYYYRGAGGTCLHPPPEHYYGAERPDGYYASGYYWPYRPYKFSQP